MPGYPLDFEDMNRIWISDIENLYPENQTHINNHNTLQPQIYIENENNRFAKGSLKKSIYSVTPPKEINRFSDTLLYVEEPETRGRNTLKFPILRRSPV